MMRRYIQESVPAGKAAKVRVVQVINTLDPADGGPAHNASALRRALDAYGHVCDAYVYKGRRQGAVPSPLSAHHRDDMTGSSWLRLLWLAISSAEFVIIHGYYLPSTLIAVGFARLQGKPYALVPHGVFTRYQRLHSPIRKKTFDITLGRYIASKCSFLAVATPTEKAEAAEIWKTPIHVTGIGMHIPKALPERRALDQKLTLLSMSRIASKKRVDVTIRALHALRAAGINAQLIIAGDANNQLGNDLKRMSRDMGIEAHIDWIGLVKGNQKEECFFNSDILLLPSEDENFGIGITEALAHGCLVVTTSQAAASSFVARSGAGRVLREPAPEEVAAAVSALWAEKDGWPLLRESARQAIERDLSWTEIARRWTSLIDEERKYS